VIAGKGGKQKRRIREREEIAYPFSAQGGKGEFLYLAAERKKGHGWRSGRKEGIVPLEQWKERRENGGKRPSEGR